MSEEHAGDAGAKQPPVETGKLGRELFALFLVFWAAFLLLSLVTYSPQDPTFNQVVSSSHQLQNGAGLVGAYLGGLLVDMCGVAAYAFPLAFVLAALKLLAARLRIAWPRWVGLVLLSACLTAAAATAWGRAHLMVGEIAGGGFMGRTLLTWSTYYLKTWGALLFWLLIFAVSSQMLTGLTWTGAGRRVRSHVGAAWQTYRERAVQRRARPKKPTPAKKDETEAIEPPAPDAAQAQEPAPTPGNASGKKPGKDDEGEMLDLPFLPESGPDDVKRGKAKPSIFKRQMPGLELLSEPAGQQNHDMEVLKHHAKQLTASLADFGVQGEVQNISPGPVVTMFEYKPAPGVKISRIAGLTDDVAMAMKAAAVRVGGATPGKDTVGIEAPNENRRTVLLRQVLGSDVFKKSESMLTMALGVDISGAPKAADLARMPHLLVAGATGAGKSVCINAIILSFLYKAKPEQVKMLLIDPKRIELAVYADLPHLVHPVVTDMSEAKNALDWCVHEMDQRYEAMARLGVRNIAGYNAKLAGLSQEQREGGLADLEPMPYLVLIIDELADLMLTAAKEVEVSIVRLAQLARAAGIHMILATQRPSVDVVTGLIKANFPCRIAFQVTSKHDSRTILDQVGAEYLLGKGDMLFKPGGGKLQRMHGAFVSDDEVIAVVSHWKAQQQPSYAVDFAEWASEADNSGGGEGEPGGMDGDPVYQEAVDFVLNQGKASISFLQRRFRIGFNRAARYIEQMEMDGIIGPADGSKPRQVLKSRE